MARCPRSTTGRTRFPLFVTSGFFGLSRVMKDGDRAASAKRPPGGGRGLLETPENTGCERIVGNGEGVIRRGSMRVWRQGG